MPPPPRGTSREERPKDEPAPRSRRRLPWAQLLRRVFFVEALRCPRCATALVVLAMISETAVVTRILTHLGLPSEPPPRAPARPARAEDGGLDELPFVDEALPEHDHQAYDGNDVPDAGAADADDEAPP